MSWYYHDGQKPVGPIEEAEIIRLAASGAISGRTPVWKQGMAEWVAADACEIKPHLVSVPPPLPQANPPPIAADRMGSHAGLATSQSPQSATAKPGSGMSALAIVGLAALCIACFIAIGFLPTWARLTLIPLCAFLAHRSRKAK